MRNCVDFPSCIENYILLTDAETRLDLKMSLGEIYNTLDWIAALFSFLSLKLRAKLRAKFF
jgi:hypothetical protein